MFYVYDMQQRILLEPKLLGAGLKTAVKKKLFSTMNGKCSADYGYILSILSISSISTTEVDPLVGHAAFLVDFKALTLLPSKGEVVDAVVHEINKMGVFAFIGPLSIFISTYQIPGHLSGTGLEPMIVPNDGGAPISRGSLIRLRIIGAKVEPLKVFAIGTINEDYLGLVQ